MRRILALTFPHLSTDRIARGRHGRTWRQTGAEAPPLVTAHKEKNAMRIAGLDAAAEARGLRRGQGLADARAAHPDLDIVPADAEADRRLLTALADWCDRYTPLVALDAPDGLFLDITGCAHLFGGEQGLLADLLARLFEQGFTACASVAATPGAAWAAARFADGPLIVEPGAEAPVLGPFPLAALRLDGETLAGLAKVGLKTVRQLAEAPRAPLARRFGRQCLLRLDQALGAVEEAISPRLPVPALSAERRLAEPVGRIEDVEQLLLALAIRLQGGLERRGAGARALEYALFRVDGVVYRLCVGASRPVRDPETVVKLFRERLASVGDELDAGFGFDVVRLSVLADGAMDDGQGDFSDGTDGGDPDLAILLDRIAARLGANAPVDARHPVSRLQAVESHEPERAEELRPAPQDTSPLPANKMSVPPAVPRPARLLARPEPVEVVAGVPEGPPQHFRWRRAHYRVTRAEGPERIAGEWWGHEASEDLHPAPRDYYRVEDEDGRRYWLFRRGLYGAAGGGVAPEWFLHGMFA
ncbi:DNA polymerase Y family protein [Oricola indica]|uniref:Y-family DNA polymerase n=1 Tax=Oricola indica TaxID=2872591 RepID=UPI003CCB9B0E